MFGIQCDDRFPVMPSEGGYDPYSIELYKKEFKVIEINTRFWVSLDASLIAGVNFPYLYCLSSMESLFQKPQYNFVEYLNLKGLIKRIKQDMKFVFKIIPIHIINFLFQGVLLMM